MFKFSGGASLKDHHNYSSSGKGGEMTSSSTHSSVIGAQETHVRVTSLIMSKEWKQNEETTDK